MGHRCPGLYILLW